METQENTKKNSHGHRQVLLTILILISVFLLFIILSATTHGPIPNSSAVLEPVNKTALSQDPDSSIVSTCANVPANKTRSVNCAEQNKSKTETSDIAQTNLTQDKLNMGSIATTTPSGAWHLTEIYSGSSIKNTTLFTIKGSQWRVTWSTHGNDSYFGADAISPDGSGGVCIIANQANSTATTNTDYSGTGMNYCYSGAGNYYIAVSTGNNWSLTVEDYY